jgi:hypothetical protein
MSADVTYEVCITPKPGYRFDALVYRSVRAGICGPWGEHTDFLHFADVVEWLAGMELRLADGVFRWAPNGFWHGDLVRVAS